MPVVTFACPKCGKVLKSPTPIPAGKKIKCPTCAAVFLMPEQAEDEMAAAVSDKPRRPGSVAPVPNDEDDDEPRRRPRRAADDEDEDEPRPRRRSRADEEDDYEDDRPRRKKAKAKGRRRAGGMGLLIGVAAVVLLLVLGGGGTTVYFVWFHGVNRGSGNEDPLAFVPPGTEILVGTDYATLLSDPALGPQFEKAIREQGKSGDFFDNVKKGTGLEFKDLLAQTVVASNLDSLNNAGMMAGGMRGGPVAAPPAAAPGRNAITMIVRSSRPFDQKKVVSSCKDPHHKTAHGKSYYEVNEGEFRTLFMPSNRTLIMSSLSAAELDPLFASNGTTPAASADAAALVRGVDKTTIWAVLPFEGKTRTKLDDGLRNDPAPPEWQALVNPVAKGKGVAIWGTLQGEQVGIGVNVACADAAAAGQVAQAAEQTWNEQKLKLTALTLPLALVAPKTAKLLSELTGSLKFGVDGTVAKASANVSRATVTAAVSEIQTLQNGQNLGGGFGRGGLPPNQGPGGGRPGRGPGKR
jgi:hypothetical protein